MSVSCLLYICGGEEHNDYSVPFGASALIHTKAPAASIDICWKKLRLKHWSDSKNIQKYENNTLGCSFPKSKVTMCKME